MRPIPTCSILLVVGVVLTYIVAVTLLPRELLPWFHDELGPVELVTEGVLIVALGLSILTARAMFRAASDAPRYAKWWHLGVAFAVMAALLEETSYGQHHFGFEPPAYFQEHSKQQELNFHNLWRDKPSSTLRSIANGGLPIFAVVLPLVMLRQPGAFARGHWSRYLLPRLEMAPWIIASMCISPVRRLGGFSDGDSVWRESLSEFKELLWAFALLAYILTMWRRHGRAEGIFTSETIAFAPLSPAGETPLHPLAGNLHASRDDG